MCTYVHICAHMCTCGHSLTMRDIPPPELPSGELLHLFSTHLQCTSAPPEEATIADTMNSRCAQLLALVEGKGSEAKSVRTQQLAELKEFVDRTWHEYAKVSSTDRTRWLLIAPQISHESCSV
jgi:hypothetical protein